MGKTEFWKTDHRAKSKLYTYVIELYKRLFLSTNFKIVIYKIGPRAAQPLNDVQNVDVRIVDAKRQNS